MNEPNDPLDAMRQAWKAERAPLPAGELAQQDTTTRSAVASIRADWARERQTPQTVPRTHLEAILERNGVLQRKRSGWKPWALAAAAACLIALSVWQPWMPVLQDPNTERVAQQSEHSSGDPHGGSNQNPTTGQAPEQDSNPEGGQGANPEQNTANGTSAPNQSGVPPVSPPEITVRPDGFEMRAGAVRMVLIDPQVQTETDPSPTTPENSSGESL